MINKLLNINLLNSKSKYYNKKLTNISIFSWSVLIIFVSLSVLNFNCYSICEHLLFFSIKRKTKGSQIFKYFLARFLNFTKIKSFVEGWKFANYCAKCYFFTQKCSETKEKNYTKIAQKFFEWKPYPHMNGPPESP